MPGLLPNEGADAGASPLQLIEVCANQQLFPQFPGAQGDLHEVGGDLVGKACIACLQY